MNTVRTIIPCLFTNNHFELEYANHEPSRVNSLLYKLNQRFIEYVARKVQRPEIEEKKTNNISVGG